MHSFLRLNRRIPIGVSSARLCVPSLLAPERSFSVLSILPLSVVHCLFLFIITIFCRILPELGSELGVPEILNSRAEVIMVAAAVNVGNRSGFVG